MIDPRNRSTPDHPNVTDMSDDDLSDRGYVDDDGDYTDAGWDAFTETDHDRYEEAILHIADMDEMNHMNDIDSDD